MKEKWPKSEDCATGYPDPILTVNGNGSISGGRQAPARRSFRFVIHDITIPPVRRQRPDARNKITFKRPTNREIPMPPGVHPDQRRVTDSIESDALCRLSAVNNPNPFTPSLALQFGIAPARSQP